MCLLQDMRQLIFFGMDASLVGYDFDVDDNGQPLNLTGAGTFPWNEDARSYMADKTSPYTAGYWCASCGNIFETWGEVRSHLSDLH
jgi:hypothetical protein